MTNSDTLRHMAYFERLGTLSERDQTWPCIAAGLIVLRQLDSRALLGLGRDAWQITAAREAVSRVPASNSMRMLLTRLLELADGDEAPAPSAVGPRLMAYGRALETTGEWGLAADVYSCTTEIVPADVDLELVTDVQSRLAYVSRMRADWDGADRAIQRASALAGRLGDARRVLRLRLSSANVAMNRGNMVRAEDILSETLALSADRKSVV